MNDQPQQHWLTRPKTIRKIWWGGLVVLALIALGDYVIHGHPYFVIDGTFGFYSWYGFITCVAMVLFAKGLGVFLKRKDTYYDE